jgi:micrococcal nuclease
MEVEGKPFDGRAEPAREPVGPLEADVAERSYVVAPDEDAVLGHREPFCLRLLFLMLTALLTVAGCTASAGRPARAPARVARVIDGDTIELVGGRRVRLVQIDTPEVQEGECYGRAAARLLASLLPPGTHVRLEADPGLDRVDRYGRLLRYVIRSGRNLNLVLVRRGAATVWFYEGDRGRYAGDLLAAARAARAVGRGLWRACPRTPFDPLHGADTGHVG